MNLPRRAIAAAVVALFGAGALWASWQLRADFANYVADRVLSLSGADVEGTVVSLDVTGAVFTGVRLGPADAPAVSADRIEFDVQPLEAVHRRYRGVALHGLEVALVLDEDGVRLKGTEPSPRRTESARRNAYLPRIDIPDAGVTIDTPAGMLRADAVMLGDVSEGWNLHATMTPASLERGEARLSLEAGELSASLAEGRLESQVEIRVAGASMLGYAAETASLTAAFDGAVGDMTGLADVAGTGAATFDVSHAGVSSERAAEFAAIIAPLLDGAAAEFAGPHAAALRAAVADAVRAFDASGQLNVAFTEAHADVSLAEPLTVTAASGAVASIARGENDDDGVVSFDFDTGAVRAVGWAAEFSGGQLPNVRAYLGEATAGAADGVASAAAVAAIEPWEIDGLELAAEITRAAVERSADGSWLGDVSGDVKFSGARFDADIDQAVFSYAVAVSGGPGYLRVSPLSDAKQTLRISRLDVAGVSARMLSADIAPLSAPGDLAVADVEGFRSVLAFSDARADIVTEGDAVWALRLPAAEVRTETSLESGSRLGARAQAPRAESTTDGGKIVVQASLLEAALDFADATGVNLRFEGSALSGAGAPVTIERAAGELDFDIADGKVGSGSFALAGAEIRDPDDIPAFATLVLSGSGPIADGVLTGALTALGLDGSRTATANVLYDFADNRGSIDYVTPRFAFAPGGLQPADVSPALRGVIADARGAMTMNGRATWDAGALAADATIKIEDIDFATHVGVVEGVSSEFVIADVLNLRTSEPQSISVAAFDPGIPLLEGNVTLSLLGGGAIGVDGAAFPFAGGSLRVEPFTITPGEERVVAILTAENVNLASVINLVRPPDVAVTGRVSGSFPVVARDRSVYIENGVLRSLEPGIISYTGAAGRDFAEADPSAKLAFDALREFQYSSIELTLNGDVAGRMDLRIRTEGSNPAVHEGYPIVFNLNTSAEFARLMQNAFNTIDFRTRLKEATGQSANEAD